MATEPPPPETCAGAVCGDNDVRPNLIAGAVDATSNHDAAAAPDEPLDETSSAADPPANPDEPPVQRQVASMQHPMTAGSSVPPSFFLGLLLLGALAWRYCKYQSSKKEWERASISQLEKIRLRNADVPQVDDTKKRGEEKGNTPEGNVAKVETDAGPNPSNDATGIHSECSQADPKKRDEWNSSEYGSNGDASDLPASDRMARIRAKQQEQLERNAKSAQRERRRQQKKKKKTLHNSLDHAAADAAHERRKSVVAEESRLLVQRTSGGEQQQALSEAEERERVALLQQQNLDYQESLQRDQQRARQLALERELRRRRKEALDQARDRLAAAGVQCDAVLGESASTSVGIDQKCRMRLLLPSGQRVQASFDRNNCIGLVYHLALLALEREHLLWNREEGELEDPEEEADPVSEEEADDERARSDSDFPPTANDYSSIRDEWSEIFHPFSVASTFPQRTYDNLDETLEDCGLGQGATLMVVVESD